MRAIFRLPVKARGIMIGFGLGPNMDQAIREALPNWGAVLFPGAPATFNTPQIQACRRAVGGDASTPILLVGFGPGVQTVFRILASNLTETLTGVSLFDGEYPEDTLPTWSRFAALSRGGKAPRMVADVRGAAEAVAAALGPAPAAPEGGEAEPARVARVLAANFGPDSAAMPEPLPPSEAP